MADGESIVLRGIQLRLPQLLLILRELSGLPEMPQSTNTEATQDIKELEIDIWAVDGSYRTRNPMKLVNMDKDVRVQVSRGNLLVGPECGMKSGPEGWLG